MISVGDDASLDESSSARASDSNVVLRSKYPECSACVSKKNGGTQKQKKGSEVMLLMSFDSKRWLYEKCCSERTGIVSIEIANPIGCFLVASPTKITLNWSFRCSMFFGTHDGFVTNDW